MNPITQALSARYPGMPPLGNVRFIASPPDSGGRKLEFYPPGEQQNPSPGHPTVQTFGRGERGDLSGIAGDLISHYFGRGADPSFTRLYNQFSSSFTPRQQATLHDQYGWAQQHGGEQRPFQQWAQASGIPAYFRGYTFNQWPAQFTQSAYTPSQKMTLNDVLRYLAGPKAYASG